MNEEENEFACFAWAETGSKRRNAEEELFEVGDESGVWRRGGEEGEKEAGAFDDVDGVPCEED